MEKGAFRLHIGKDAEAFRALSTVTPKRAVRVIAEMRKGLVCGAMRDAPARRVDSPTESEIAYPQ